jgi:hypothetical protein
VIQSVSLEPTVALVGGSNVDRASSASWEKKVYRFNGIYRWYHFITGAVFLGFAGAVHEFWVLSIVIALFAGFMILRPIATSLTLDQNSITLKTTFSEHSLERSSIASIERVNTGKGGLLRLRAIDGSEMNIGVGLFAFDEAWNEWLSTYTDLSDDKPLTLFPPVRKS